MKAVRFDEYGGVEVLHLAEVPTPAPGLGQVLVQVKAAGINPGEANTRGGQLQSLFPVVFPSGEGADFAGIVTEPGPDVAGPEAGDEVIGFTNKSASHAEYVLAGAEDLTAKPPSVPWEVAGSLFVVGLTADAAVRAVGLAEGDTVVVCGAAGGVGSIAVQLARLAGANVIGLASKPNHEWLAAHGVIPVSYGDGVAERIRQTAGKVDAFIDTFGEDYVELAIDLGVEPSRIDTTANPSAGEEYGAIVVDLSWIISGADSEGSGAGPSAAVLAELAGHISAGQLEVPIAATFPLAQVREAYELLASGHVRGKVVLVP